MTKIYSLYGKDERKIDNLKRKIRGYEKMKIDLLRLNKKLNKENKKLKEKYKKALTMLSDYSCPCELDNFNTKEENIEYCSMNCSVDTDIFIKCWDRYIEQSLRSDKNV